MRPFTTTSLATFDLGQRLQFRITRERGWLEQAVGVAIVIVFSIQAYRQHSWWIAAGGVLGAAGFVADAIHGSETEVDITPAKITIKGNLGRMFATETHLEIRTLTELNYDYGDEGRQKGLYARQNWQSTCILAGVTELQAADIRDLILSRFPELNAQMSGDSIVFGKRSDTITLDL